MTRRALLIATGTYEDPAIDNLQAPANDIDAVERVLGDALIGGFQILPKCLDQEEHVIRGQIADLCESSRSDDVLLIWFAGHGWPDDQNILHIGAQNTQRDRLSTTAVSTEFLRDRLRAANARHVFIILDCCYSGLIHDQMKVRGGEDERIFLQPFQELQQSDGVRGISVLSSSRADQRAWERQESSIFARVMVDALDRGDADKDGDGVIFIHDVKNYMAKRLQSVETMQEPILLDLSGPRPPHFAHVPDLYAVDFTTYETEVIAAAEANHRPVTSNIVRRYNLRGEFQIPNFVLSSRTIASDVTHTLDFWKEQKVRYARRALIRDLETAHQNHYKSLFEDFYSGNEGPLRQAIKNSLIAPRLAESLAAEAGPTGMLTEDEVAEAVAGYTQQEVAHAMRSAFVSEEEPQQIPDYAPVPNTNRLKTALDQLKVRHIAELILPPPADGVRPALALAGNLVDAMDDDLVVVSARHNAESAYEGDQYSAATRAFDLIEALTPQERRNLFWFQVTRGFGPLSTPNEIVRAIEDRRRLGLDDESARFVVFSKLKHRDEPGMARLSKIFGLIENGSVVQALNALGELPQTPASTALREELQGWMDRASGWLDDARMTSSRIEAANLVGRARALVDDLVVNTEMMERLRSQPPSSISVRPSGDGVQIQWVAQVGRDQSEAHYVVFRYSGNEPSGTQIARTPSTVYLDSLAPPNTELVYAVATESLGQRSAEQRSAGFVLIRPPPTGIKAEARDGEVYLQWDTQQHKVRIERRTGPDATWKIITTSDTGSYHDTLLTNGIDYYYRLTVLYPDDAGTMQPSDGRIVVSKPAKLTVPAEISSMQLDESDSSLLRIRCVCSAGAEVTVSEASTSMWTSGAATRAATDRPTWRTETLSRAQRSDGREDVEIRFRVPESERELELITGEASSATIGESFKWRAPAVISSLIAERRDGTLTVAWTWEETQSAEVELTVRQSDGSSVIHHTRDSPFEVTASGLATTVEARSLARAGRFTVAAPPWIERVPAALSLTVTITRPRRSHRKWFRTNPSEIIVRIESDQPMVVPRLLIVGKPGDLLPIDDDDETARQLHIVDTGGVRDRDLLKDDHELAIDQNTKLDLIVRIRNRVRPYWISVMASPGILVRQAPISQRRLS